jgi:ribose transport system ATP-binding protein
MAPALLEMTGVTKSFGGVQALRGVDFTLLAGEIHGLAGAVLARQAVDRARP